MPLNSGKQRRKRSSKTRMSDYCHDENREKCRGWQKGKGRNTASGVSSKFVPAQDVTVQAFADNASCRALSRTSKAATTSIRKGEDDADDVSCSSLSVHGDSDVEVSNNVHVVEPYQYKPFLTEEEWQQSDEDNEFVITNDEPEANQQPWWCDCGKCTDEMPDEENFTCCKNVRQFRDKWQETNFPEDMAELCFTEHPWFEAVCLNPGTLQTAYLQYRQQYGAQAMKGDQASYRKFRQTAYRQVVRWCWGNLGRHNQVDLPSCIMRKVRDAYPCDTDGNYEGFKNPPLNKRQVYDWK